MKIFDILMSWLQPKPHKQSDNKLAKTVINIMENEVKEITEPLFAELKNAQLKNHELLTSTCQDAEFITNTTAITRQLITEVREFIAVETSIENILLKRNIEKHICQLEILYNAKSSHITKH